MTQPEEKVGAGQEEVIEDQEPVAGTAPAGEPAPTPEDEWLVPDRFKKGQEGELAKSYLEAEAEMHRAQNRAAEAERLLESERQTAARPAPEAEPEVLDDDYLTAGAVRRLVEKGIQQGLSVVLPTVLEGAAAGTLQSVMADKAAKDPYFEVVREDFDAMVRSLPPEQRANRQALEFAYNMARGQNMEKIVEAAAKGRLRPPAGGARVEGARPSTGSEPVNLTAEEDRVRRGMGLSVEDWKKQKAEEA